MLVELAEVSQLRFADGAPVRAASAVGRYGAGLLVAQDDSTLGFWLRGEVGVQLRLLPPVEGHDQFAEALGTKHLKPDLEAATEVDGGGVLLLGSGSTTARMRSVLLDPDPDVDPVVADLAPLYARVAQVLGVHPDQLNLEGACVVHSHGSDLLRWFQRGLPSAGVPTASVDLDLATLLEVASGAADVTRIEVGDVRGYDLGDVGGIGLAVTDAVTLGDHLLVSAAAEDSPNAYDDGPVVASALAVLDGDSVVALATLPLLEGQVAKVEGLTVLEWSAAGGRLIATVDADDVEVPSSLLTLEVTL